MKRNVSLIAMLVATLSITGCVSVGKIDAATLHDLGPLREQQTPALPALRPVSIAEIRAPAWLDSNMMFYRLDYANALQPRTYAYARWTMPPAQLLMQQLKARIAQAGGIALPASDGALDVPVLRIELDDFTQNFDAPDRSVGTVSLRASAYKGRALVAQKSFIRQAPASSADASGGASALAAASNAAVADIIVWLDSLHLK